MSTRSIGRLVLFPALAGLAAIPGCTSEAPTTAPTNQLHATQSFSAAQLNAPLSPSAKKSGAQVAPPPMR